MANQLHLFQPTKSRQSLANDIWRACDILRRDNNPRPVIRFIVQLTIYDQTAGSCGFLAHAYQHIIARAGEGLTIEQDEFLQQRAFYGQEKRAVPALLGLMNMVLHGVTAPNVTRRNTLEKNIRDVKERFDVILTNPPFGGTENRQIQANFPVRASAAELLFLQHIMH